VVRNAFLVVLLFAAMCAGCYWIAGQETPGDNRVILVAIDRSRSMHYSDPARLALYGAQLTFTLAPKTSQMGAVAYGDATKELVLIATLPTKREREIACRRVSEVALEGTGNLGNAIADLRQLLEKSGAGKRSRLVIFSDGKCTQDDLDAMSEELVKFKEKNWRIHTISLTPKTSTPIFASISQSTGGKHFKVEKLQELIETCLRATMEGENLFNFVGHTDSITVLPETERLLLVAMENSASGGFDDIFMVKQPSGKIVRVRKSDDNLFTFPPEEARDCGFEAVNIWDPPAGVWYVGARPQTEKVYVSANLPLLASLAGLKDSFLEGEPLDIQFSLATEERDLFALIKKSGECSVSVTTDGAPAADPLHLTARFEETEGESGVHKCIYTGRTHLFLREPGKLQKILLTLTFTIACPDGARWQYRKEAQFELNPGPPPLICQPEKVNFGSLWTDFIEETLSQELQFSTTVSGAVNVSLASELPPSLSISAREFKLSDAGAPIKVNLLLEVAKPETLGIHEEKLTFTPKISETGCCARQLVLPVTFAAYRFTGSDIEMRGYPAETVKSPLNFSVQPQAGLSFRIEKLVGPRDLPAKITGEGSQQTLEVAVPADASDGDYTGELEIVTSAEGLAPRKQKVTLRIDASPKLILKPERIQLEADRNGWIETPLTIAAQHFEDVQISVEPANLTNPQVSAVVSSELDIELVPEKGWDGKSLSPATKKTFFLRVMVSSDLPAAKYEGKVTVKATFRGERTITEELPVILEVSR
jgi:hypothetical protein